MTARDHEVPRPAYRSWWLEDALAADPGEPCPPLAERVEADVVVLGGGYTGMWTAWFLKELQPALEVVLLEQDICGGGPSGRNGGFVNSFWGYLEDALELFGHERGLALCLAGERSVEDIGRWCEEHGVDAWFTPAGDLGVETSPAQAGRWHGAVRAAERLGFSDRLVGLGPDQVAARCRSPVFAAGMLTTDAATVQPARLARGLHRVLLERGVRIFEHTPVRRFRSGDPVIAETPLGSVRAPHAVVALNAWAAAWRAFRRQVAVRGTYMVVTEPAPDRLRDIGWTDGVAIWNMRSAVNYLRTTNDGRIAFGTGGMQPGSACPSDPRFGYDQRFVRVVAAEFRRMFPSFAGVRLEAAWGGPIDVSGDHMPIFGSSPGGNVHHGLGYTGNGVGPSHLGGRILAKLALGIDDEDTRLPLVRRRPKRFPPGPLRSLGSLAVNRAILAKDRAEDEGRRPGPLTSFVARLPRRFGYRLGPS